MKTILVVEDTLELREEISELLELERYNVLSANDGRQGLEVAKHQLPDLILSDVLMPQMNGYEMLSELKKDARTRFIPTIFLTSKNTFEDMRMGMEFGAEDYLPKPIAADTLLSAINTQLQKHEDIEKRMDELRANISKNLPHEMRTPLNQIIGFSSLLKDSSLEYDIEDIQRMASYIYDGGYRLYRIIENYLLYSELKVTLENIDAIKQIRKVNAFDVWPILEKVAKEKGRQYGRMDDLQLSGLQVYLKMDHVHFTKLTEELIDNAFKFSIAGAKVSINLFLENKCLILEITNQGRSMTVEQLAAIGAFMQFERQQLEQQGLGLGLAIVEYIVELYGGELFFETRKRNSLTVRVKFSENKEFSCFVTDDSRAR